MSTSTDDDLMQFVAVNRTGLVCLTCGEEFRRFDPFTTVTQVLQAARFHQARCDEEVVEP